MTIYYWFSFYLRCVNIKVYERLRRVAVNRSSYIKIEDLLTEFRPMIPLQGSFVAIKVVLYVVSSVWSCSTPAEETKGVDLVGQDATLCNGQSGPSHKKSCVL